MSQEIMQDAIGTAQRYIAEHTPEVATAPMRQRYHFMGPCGWINDPNGLIYYRGQYHFFYQFNPYSAFWSQMHWGHAVSNDMLHWTHLPVALAPSESYDQHPQGGCFSGSAIEKDGRLYLLYTGTANNGHGFEQTQNIAVSDDGVHFSKYEGNPVIEPPEGVPHDFFRDPKVWEHEGSYYLVCGAQKSGKAVALLYRSTDLLHWSFFNVLFESRGEWGYMWECPDFFPLGNKWVFICSPMGVGERTTVYFVGDFDYETGTFVYTVTGELDWGHDFYAPQTFVDAQNRRLVVAWANAWDWMPFWKDWGPTYREGWCGSFCIPRVLELREDLTLSMMPIEELSALKDEGNQIAQLQVGNSISSLSAGDGISYELAFTIDLTRSDAAWLELNLRCGSGRALRCRFDFAKANMSVGRDNADGWSEGTSHSPLPLTESDELEVLILSDQSSVEIFVDGGRIVHSMNIFAGQDQNGIEVKAHRGEVYLTDIRTHSIRTVAEVF
ncbi:MAG: glycoside hydrolase family 32 protein [Bifidobacterium sp.]|jgi:beta-fructofuranosidase|nr:glycoside hydrolase family 32 protein [Bifidobacterium sp.]MCH4175610.1 glycoside hydrolase family 32 protein [Bifidobacterium sp.]